MKKRYNLAELRYYERTQYGFDISDCLSYVFIEKMDPYSGYDYQNVFTDEQYPIVRFNDYGYDRYFYFEENYGNIYDKYGDSGLCYVLTDVAVDNLPMDDLKHIVLYSDHYFKDRRELMDEMLESEYNTSLRRTTFEDLTNYEQMINYLDEKGFDFENRGKKLVR